MIPIFVALGMIAFGMSQDKPKKSIKKMAKGGNIIDLKENDYVWNALGKKLIVDKVTNDEYYLTSFMQKGSSPFSKKKINDYIKKGEWTLKPKKMAKGGDIEEKDLFEYYDEQPIKLQKLFAKRKYEPIFNDGDFDYNDLKELLKETEKLGYTFEIGMDRLPYDLRKK